MLRTFRPKPSATAAISSLLPFGSTDKFAQIRHKASFRGRGKNRHVGHYYLGRNVKIKLLFRQGNTLGLKEGSTKTLNAKLFSAGAYLPSSNGWRRVDKYADKVGAVIVPE